MTVTSARAVYRVRLLLVDLLASFFQTEPDAERMSRWRGIFSALVKEPINPVFDRAVADIHGILNERSLADLQREYYELFVNPFGGSGVQTMASWYLDGRSFGQTLVSLRGFLAEAGFTREEGMRESEDSLPVLLDFLAHLIEEEKNGESLAASRLQTRLRTEYLAPFAAALTVAVEHQKTTGFYLSCCRLLCAYLDLEQGLPAPS